MTAFLRHLSLALGFLLAAGGSLPADPEPPKDDKQVRTDQYGDPLPSGALARIGGIRLRHGSGVEGLAFSADGKTLASAGGDGTVRVWDVGTGKERVQIDLRPLKLYAGVVLALTPDSKTLAFTSQEQTIH